MRILVDNGCYDLLNQGDVAMLQVTVARLSSLWPTALIYVLTDAPDRLAACCPQARPLHPDTRLRWRATGRLFGRLHQVGPAWVVRRWLQLERTIWRYWPELAVRLIRLKINRRGLKLNLAEVRAFATAFLGADLVIASGGGYMTDTFKWLALQILDTLETAAQFGIPTAMVSQGLGPIQQEELWARAKTVLPNLSLVTIREQRVGVALLNSFGVVADRVMITGDDSIELAYEKRPAKLGTGIGISLRMAKWLTVNLDLVETIRTVLHQAAHHYGAPLIPLPTSFYHEESDVATLRQLLAGYNDDWEAGNDFDTPFKVIEQVGGCRLVVTGSYHPAVFALAQGLPIVALVNSPYYFDKFMGLIDQFGGGGEVILLDDEQLPQKLMRAIETAWQSAERINHTLLLAAVRQIEAGQSAYQRLYHLVEHDGQNTSLA